MKNEYKELRKKLKDEFSRINNGKVYESIGSVGLWVKQCGIKPTVIHTNIICGILGRVPFVYQQSDRKIILSYLKKHKYKDFKLIKQN